MTYESEFFDWLKEDGSLDKYEALLDHSEDYAGDQSFRLRAVGELEIIRDRFKQDQEDK